jgi:hypothetical protein
MEGHTQFAIVDGHKMLHRLTQGRALWRLALSVQRYTQVTNPTIELQNKRILRCLRL